MAFILIGPMKNTLSQSKVTQKISGQQLEFTSILKRLNENKFSGRWHVNGKRRGINARRITWTFFFDYGRVLFVNGGLHPVRHLQSLLQKHTQNSVYQQIWRSLSDISVNSETLCWEFEVLKSNLKHGTLNREQFAGIVQETLTDAIFDIWHLTNIRFDIKPKELSQLSSIVFIDPKQALDDARKEWSIWYQKGILLCQPDCGITIKQPAILQAETTASTYKMMESMLDGQFSLREIAAKANKDVKVIAHSLLPFLNKGALSLTEIPDLPCPLKFNFDIKAKNVGPKFTIACIDDSPLICKQIQRLVTEVGYDYVSIQNPLRAIVTLLRSKPDLIFLDLVMPYTNGYEICSQLRKIHHFQDVPIIILTGNDGIVDRVRAKLVGCTDFISKPLAPSTLHSLMATHLLQEATAG